MIIQWTINMMTKPEMRIAIAESLGWIRVNTGPVNIHLWIHKDCSICNSGEAHSHSIDELPNYPESLDACREFQRTLDSDEQMTYEDHLSIIEDHKGCYQWELEAEDHCIAYLKTKGLWKE